MTRSDQCTAKNVKKSCQIQPPASSPDPHPDGIPIRIPIYMGFIPSRSPSKWDSHPNPHPNGIPIQIPIQMENLSGSPSRWDSHPDPRPDGKPIRIPIHMGSPPRWDPKTTPCPHAPVFKLGLLNSRNKLGGARCARADACTLKSAKTPLNTMYRD